MSYVPCMPMRSPCKAHGSAVEHRSNSKQANNSQQPTQAHRSPCKAHGTNNSPCAKKMGGNGQNMGRVGARKRISDIITHYIGNWDSPWFPLSAEIFAEVRHGLPTPHTTDLTTLLRYI